jgi:hypothetical protein
MKLYRFSPIKNKEQLMEAITYTHFACFELCKKVFGVYLPASGNIGIFCHYDDEYEFLTKLREELTDRNDNWNQKYFRLHKPITIPQKNDIPETTYTYLYIRKPDKEKPEVGDVDVVLKKEKFSKLKDTSVSGNKINDVDILYRPDLDMLRLSNPDSDVLPYITTTFMNQKGF